MPGLWLPVVRKTRSGNEYSPFTLGCATFPKIIHVLQEPAFDIGPLIARAVAAESEEQDDHEGDDDEAGQASLADARDELLPPPLGLDQGQPFPPPKQLDPPPPIAASPQPAASPKPATNPKPRPGPQRSSTKAEKAQKARAASHNRGRAKHARDLAAHGHLPSPATVSTIVRPAAPLKTDLNASALPTAFGAYSGKLEDKIEKKGSKVQRSVADLVGLGFQLVKWDGITLRPLLDKNGRIIAVLAGRSNDAKYLESANSAFRTIRDAGAAANFPASMRHHRHGLFAAMNVGLFYGKVQKFPCWLNNKGYAALADGLLGDCHIQRLACFADAAFALWAPRLYRYYRDNDAGLQRRMSFRRPFVGSIFACAAFNFGPNVWTFRHRDVLNLAFGWCTVNALGEFDATTGGHLVLEDLKLVVEFPHSALILLPSATVAHSNVPVQPGEERVSFTQFTPGGIFRFVDNGGQTVDELAERNPSEYDRIMARKAARWEEGLSLLSTLDELLPEE
ncbi:hypothetical protein DFH07DRAFT_966678 [Mycena maculata]|uniref:Uncharacterized protein n=1 Tax=Mycena maculata TaxID=230809 RepID=A0AAD7I7T7_9AGAR|nr:hypothetical protein DFH07DRAFT_966678 [Mycena maculata]